MRKILKIGFVALLLSVGYGPMAAQEQDILISDFRQVTTDITGSVRPVMDNSGEYCSTIQFLVRDTTFVIESTVGVLKRESDVGSIRIWLPRIAKRLTIKKYGLFPLVYDIPISMKPKASYHTYLWATKDVPPPEEPIETPEPQVIVEEPIAVEEPEVAQQPQTPKIPRDWKTKGYMGLSYNLFSIDGPSLSFGLDLNHHIIELSGIYGIKKTDDLYIYSGNELKAGYRYQASRGLLRYGYDIRAGIVGFMPQVGVAANLFTLEPLKEAGMKTNDYRYTYSISAIGALRLSVTIGKYMKLHVTPEYDFGVYKSNHLKLVNDYDNDLKKWTEGFGLNAGLIIMF